MRHASGARGPPFCAQVLTLQRQLPGAVPKHAKALSQRPEDARFESAAAPAGAVQSAPAPVLAPLPQPAMMPANVKVRLVSGKYTTGAAAEHALLCTAMCCFVGLAKNILGVLRSNRQCGGEAGTVAVQVRISACSLGAEFA